MKIGARPTDDQILAAMKRAGQGQVSYVIRNWLMDKEFGRFDNLNTSHVLYRLKKLEKQGKVKRSARQWYADMISWDLVE